MGGWWYIGFGIVFTVYALDLLFLFFASLFATVVEHFVPPISTAATRKAAQRQRLAAAKQQQAALKAKSARGGSSGGANAGAAGGAAPGAANPADLSIVVDTRNGAAAAGAAGAAAGPAAAAGDAAAGAGAKASAVPGADRFSHLTDLYRGEFPKVMIQLPMYNEDAHCDLIIQRCCKVLWPSHRILIQVCDDSTREAVRKKVDAAVISALEQGHNVQLVRRDNRQGFKAGAMVDGMARVADQGFEYVAIFDADFEPPADFFYQTVIHMMRDDNLAFVQTRWVFTNCNSLLTWAQKVGLEFHFAVEQRARSFLGQFFNFNGTAGVWRIKAIHDAGGWESDTVVEDMDLSLRVYLRGWRSLYLHDVCCPNELPSTLSAYKTQQFRWLSGPMQIVRKSFSNIWRCKEIGFFSKLNCYWFFCRYFVFALVTLVALLASPIILWLDPWRWGFPTIFFLVSANMAVVVYLYFTLLSYVFLLFSVTLGYFKLWAMISGILGLKKSKSWKVTLKFAANDNNSWLRSYHKPYTLELALFAYYGALLGVSIWYEIWGLVAYNGVMALAFLVVSFGDYFL
ncbi:glucomannan 4-beta-mannosyltransferase [Raphidocelis subcapitata]|uniref:glucomannan 4-beta-mannosyltransferase n=1 Tax=Raphidocelis subcapitata TaxID=307507 RepID=A0A2V0P444_9CHLO|nr:glucomannan 4-beta-mannosyltransferase [Raphidocelis subcapitata]|eukprot:GBF91855.1 glucomannan 4-beta-mannosyltransferase [Raphidocelis subcapitata]